MSETGADRPKADNPKKGLTYESAGVSIDAGDAFARAISRHMRTTFGPRVIENPGGFAGLFRLDYNESLFRHNYKDPVLVACTDGVGTKIKLAQTTNTWDTIGIDLVAMSVNDLVVQGAEPLLFLDYIACGKVDQQRLERIVAGVSQACAACDTALLGGETAEMPDIYGEDDIDLAGFAVGVVELRKATDSGRVEPGDVIIGLESDGVHSNGYSLVRAIVKEAGLDYNETYPELDADRTLGQVLLTPTRLYARSVIRVQRKYTVKRVISGMAHVTGGGLAGNLERSLHEKVDAKIDLTAWDVPQQFRFLQEKGGVDEAEMRRVFNMGIGYVLIVRPSFASSIVRRFERLGERPVVLGEITKGTGKVK
jgi:phosphoribosylformylglycinamidine cyclo-ligase